MSLAKFFCCVFAPSPRSARNESADAPVTALRARSFVVDQGRKHENSRNRRDRLPIVANPESKQPSQHLDDDDDDDEMVIQFCATSA